MKNFIENIFKHKKELVGAFVIIWAVFLFVYIQVNSRSMPENLEIKLKELCKNVPPDFRQFGSPSSLIKIDRGGYYLKFNSNMTYDEVKDYYSSRLKSDNWKMQESPSYNISDFKKTEYLTFSKDGYEISIETANLKNDDSEKAFFVGCGFQAY